MDSTVLYNSTDDAMALWYNSNSTSSVLVSNTSVNEATNTVISSTNDGKYILFGTISLVVFCVAVIILINVFFRSRQQSTKLCRLTCGKKHAGVEQSLSKQIIDIEEFRILDSPRNLAQTSLLEFNLDDSYVKARRELNINSFGHVVDGERDSFVDLESGYDFHRDSVSICHRWLLDAVDVLDVIVEEPEESLSQSSNSGHSPSCKSNSRTDLRTESHGESFGTDTGSLFKSCSDGSSYSILDTAFSESTATDYKTCPEVAPNMQQDVDQGSKIGQGQDEVRVDNDSGTSTEVSSGCFDELSYVDFRTLPTSASDDTTLQPLYQCFDPLIRAATDSLSRPPSPVSSTDTPLQSSPC